MRAPAFLAEATARANRAEVTHLASLIQSRITPGGIVGILGLSYKANTNVVEESQGLFLAHFLASQNTSVVAYDPAGMENARKVLPSQIQFALSAEECAGAADVVVIATPWKEFLSLSASQLARDGNPRVVIDCWRLFTPDHFQGTVQYIQLGVGLIH